MAKVQDTRRRGARPAAPGAFPQDHSGGGTELPLRTTGYTVRSSDNKSFRNAVLSISGAMVVVLVIMSYNYDGAYVSEAVLTAIDEMEGGAKKVTAYPPRDVPAAANTNNAGKLSSGGKVRDSQKVVINGKRYSASEATGEIKAPPKQSIREIDDPHKGIISDATGAWPTSTILKIYQDRKDCQGSSTKYETSKELEETDEKTDLIQIPVGVNTKNGDPAGMSMQIIGPGELKLYNQEGHYVGSLVEMEGCLPIFPWPPVRKGMLAHRKTNPGKQCQIDPDLQKQFATTKDLTQPHTRIVYSAESSDYFGYQTLSNAYAFMDSSQTEASWTRLLTCETPDDLSKSFPTFTSPRSLYSKRYGPINKPDVIEKWLASECDAPQPDDNIVVIDPDNFLMKDMKRWTDQVSRNNALGQGAYYAGSPKLQEMWKEVCEEGCDNKVDGVGVPYAIKAADLKKVAPLWRYYTFKVKELVETDPAFKERYEKHLNVMWAAEMFGYNYACAHLSIKTKIMIDMQARDVDPSIPLDSPDPPAMIHMGRAWFPKEHVDAAEPFRHTEGSNFINGNERAVQVFCKCNQTASTIIPWPVPEKGLDWQSYHTLRIMHDGVTHFGGVQENELFRHKPPEGYYWTKN